MGVVLGILGFLLVGTIICIPFIEDFM
jgi:hypothetical protein